MTRKNIDGLEIKLLQGALIRLYLSRCGRYNEAYPDFMGTGPVYDPEVDENLLIGLLEDARNEWRIQIRRRGRERQLEAERQDRELMEPIPDTQRT